MRHRNAGTKLSRTSAHRLALFRNLSASLFLVGKVETTLAKAKACRPFAERLITRAKGGTLHDRRLVAARLRHPEAERKLFGEIADRYRARQGGYTAIHRLEKNRLRDDAAMAVFELVTWDPGEKPKAKRRKKAPPKVHPKKEAPAKDAAPAAPEAKPEAKPGGDPEAKPDAKPATKDDAPAAPAKEPAAPPSPPKDAPPKP
jgi:large subunit ribosomal protein L17